MGAYRGDHRTSKYEPIPERVLGPAPTNFLRQRVGSSALTIFLAEDDAILAYKNGNRVVYGADYEYSDRIRQHFGHKVVEKAYADAEAEVGNNNTAEYFEAMLRKVYQNPALELQHIMVEINSANDSNTYIYGIVDSEQEI
jgi:hypothetical protein